MMSEALRAVEPSSTRGDACKPGEHAGIEADACTPPGDWVDEDVLILGDGDFSYSEAVSRNPKYRSLLSSSFDTASELEQKYGAGYIAEVVQTLLARGVRVAHGVDATNMTGTLPYADPSLTFDRIVFNFPHPGGKSKIHLSRALLNNFFASASKHLRRDGLIVVTLARGQGGTSYDTVKRDKHNSWQIAENAADHGFILTGWAPFSPLDGYRSSGHRCTKRSFVTRDGMTHVFSRDYTGKRDLCLLEWNFDISMWIVNEKQFDEELLMRRIEEMLGKSLLSCTLRSSSRLVPKDMGPSVGEMLTHCYTLTYVSSTGRALGRERALALHEMLRAGLGPAVDGTVRVR